MPKSASGCPKTVYFGASGREFRAILRLPRGLCEIFFPLQQAVSQYVNKMSLIFLKKYFVGLEKGCTFAAVFHQRRTE